LAFPEWALWTGGAVAAFAVGALVGAAYFAVLWRSVAALTGAREAPAQGGRAQPQRLGPLAAGALLRTGAVALVAALLLRAGVAPVLMLVALLGFATARHRSLAKRPPAARKGG
jgi:hypothetical protein